ncbi:hypothetical protein MESS4_p40046 [Mesorhizobium sp. STM 4661]|nr:hypothetical protein MESS4_p40046 [Mesorhizobium sp. STM 4661]
MQSRMLVLMFNFRPGELQSYGRQGYNVELCQGLGSTLCSKHQSQAIYCRIALRYLENGTGSLLIEAV